MFTALEEALLHLLRNGFLNAKAREQAQRRQTPPTACSTAGLFGVPGLLVQYLAPPSTYQEVAQIIMLARKHCVATPPLLADLMGSGRGSCCFRLPAKEKPVALRLNLPGPHDPEKAVPVEEARTVGSTLVTVVRSPGR